MKTHEKIAIIATTLLFCSNIIFCLFQLFHGNHAFTFLLVYSIIMLPRGIYMLVKKDAYFKGFAISALEKSYCKHGGKFAETLPFDAFYIVAVLVLFFVLAFVSAFLL